MTHRVLVLGGTGMLGHRVWLAARTRHETWVTCRRTTATRPLDPTRTIGGLDLTRDDDLGRLFEAVAPTVVVNAAGLVKQRPDGADDVAAIAVNALLPHRLAARCRAAGARLIHISTDCVFSGRRGGYAEDDPPDPVDLYGRSKWLGEVTAPGCLTLRLSLVGRELGTRHGLVEWFLGQVAGGAGAVPGYPRAVFSGVTTDVAARLLVSLIEEQPSLGGLFHVAAAPVTKRAFLEMLASAVGADVAVVPDDRVVIDRSLDGRRFAAATGWQAPSWARMIEDLAAEAAVYEDWRTGGY